MDTDTPEPAEAAAPGTVCTCPMHAKIRQDHPGNCPECGMTLEPLVPAPEAQASADLDDFKRRFRATPPLTIAVAVLAMSGHRLGLLEPRTQAWGELARSRTPAALKSLLRLARRILPGGAEENVPLAPVQVGDGCVSALADSRIEASGRQGHRRHARYGRHPDHVGRLAPGAAQHGGAPGKHGTACLHDALRQKRLHGPSS